MENAKDYVLVIIGVDEYGQKELLAIEDGYRESKDSWKNLLRSLKERGLSEAPKVAVGDAVLGFWSAISEEFPSTDHQRCWVHKTCNILDKMLFLKTKFLFTLSRVILGIPLELVALWKLGLALK